MSKTTLQTLERGILALEVVAGRENGIGIADLANELGLHRTIAYRLVATLEGHGLVYRNEEGQVFLGVGLLKLAASVQPQLRALARPLLIELANETRATAFVSVPQGGDCAAIMVAEPEEMVLRVGYRVGSRHPLSIGAAGIAILAGRPESAGDDAAVRQARERGYAVSRSQLQPGAVGVACPLFPSESYRPEFEASVGVVAMEDLDVDRSVHAVTGCVTKLAAMLR